MIAFLASYSPRILAGGLPSHMVHFTSTPACLFKTKQQEVIVGFPSAFSPGFTNAGGHISPRKPDGGTVLQAVWMAQDRKQRPHQGVFLIDP